MPPLQGFANYNDAFVTMAEHYDEFIGSYTMKQPNIWYDRISRGAYKLFNGVSPRYHTFRGGLPDQAGLSDWSAIATSRKPDGPDAGFDNCAAPTPRIYGYSMELIEYSGWRDSWQSLPLCVNDLKFVDYAREQVAHVIATGVEYGVSMLETFNREMYVREAMQNSRGMVMATGALGFEDSADYRFTYDAFETTTDVDGETVPYIVIPGGIEMSTLDWAYLDYISYSLAARCPQAALAQESGMPIWGLLIDVMDWERMIKGDNDLRSDWREAKPEQLIEGYDMGMTRYRRYAIIHDARQMRFRVKGFNDDGDIVATRVLPLRDGRA